MVTKDILYYMGFLFPFYFSSAANYISTHKSNNILFNRIVYRYQTKKIRPPRQITLAPEITYRAINEMCTKHKKFCTEYLSEKIQMS